jgi:hypothetical protein
MYETYIVPIVCVLSSAAQSLLQLSSAHTPLPAGAVSDQYARLL